MVVVVVDSGLGNNRSVQNMARKAGYDATISDSPDVVSNASCLILPGVGSFDAGVRALRERALWEAIAVAHGRKVPILGICLGMQLLSSGSAEGRESGFGFVEAYFEKISGGGLKVPHVGWNAVSPVTPSPLFPDVPERYRFYFVHSFFAVPAGGAQVLATVHYGTDFCCAYRQENVFGVQFHPEKSHRYGLTLMQGFLREYANQ